jgi:hypothetical protein
MKKRGPPRKKELTPTLRLPLALRERACFYYCPYRGLPSGLRRFPYLDRSLPSGFRRFP